MLAAAMNTRVFRSTGAALAASLALAFAPGLVMDANAATGHRVRGIAPKTSQLGMPLTRQIRDRVITRSARSVPVLPAGTSGGQLSTAGTTVNIFQSAGFVPDNALRQQTADFFGGLLHEEELSELTVYLVPRDEMQSLCSEEADSCYFPGQDLMVLLGDGSQVGVTMADLAAHEYGHHIANYRRNGVAEDGSAGDLGPEYWATNQQVCQRTDNGTAFPGDEGDNYSLNPAEAWAETVRLLNGGSDMWNIIDDSFYPDDAALAAAQEDILNPWDEAGTDIDISRLFRRGRSRSSVVTVNVGYDGAVLGRIRSARGLDVDLYLYDRTGRHLLTKSRRTGRSDYFGVTLCGYRKVLLQLWRYKGYGRVRGTINTP